MDRIHASGWICPLLFCLVMAVSTPSLHAAAHRVRSSDSSVIASAVHRASSTATDTAGADSSWNSARALGLIERARERRQLPDYDALQNYQADADGYVYFYVDPDDSTDRTLVKVDQVALEVYWASPNRTHQRIIGLRDELRLPSKIHYHLDHLAVVQNEFDDRIRIGDGDEVRDVLHPAAPGSNSVYDFRLVDSMSIALGGDPEPIRVYEVEVRPQDMERPGLIGSIFLDHGTAAIVRMTFTFTPASYVDRRLDYINISLDNGLWDGQHWLPNEQRLEIRRELPALDFPAGTVIRGVFRIGGYRFNEPLPNHLFSGREIVTLPRSIREKHAFPTGLFDDLDGEGLATRAELSELRAHAVRLAGRRALSGLPRLRLYLPDASSVLRYNRAEGARIGAGLSYTIDGASTARLTGGYATGPGHIGTAVEIDRDVGSGQFTLTAERNAPLELGTRPSASGALNTLHAAWAARDFHDLYFTTAARLGYTRPLSGRWRASLELAHERHHAPTLARPDAPFNGDARFRDVFAIDEGDLTSARLELERSPAAEAAAEWGTRLELDLGTFEGDTYLRPTVELQARRRSASHRLAVESRLVAGIGLGTLPAQRLFVFGGRTTLPGYAFHSFTGDRFALASGTASVDLFGPWVRLRALGAAGWSTLSRAVPPAEWGTSVTGGVRTSLGLGVGLVYDVLRVDLVRGLAGGGRWETVISVNPRFWSIL